MEYAFDDMADRDADTVALLRNEIRAHKQTEERLQRALDNLAVLNGISALANQSLNLQVFLSESLSRAAESLSSREGAVFLLDEADQAAPSSKPVVAAQQGISLEGIKQLHAAVGDRGIVAWIIEHREALILSDLSRDSRFPEVRRMQENGIILAPIRAEAQVLGIIGLARPRRQVYREEEITLLSSIADQIGVAVRSDHLRERAQRATLLEERQRLARDLHDSLAQALYGMVLLADACRESAEAANLEQTRRHVQELGEMAHQSLKEMRLLIYELRPQVLEQEGLVGTLRRRLKAVENRGGIQTQLVTAGELAIPMSLEMDLYRITQEALNNILRHSGATRVSLNLSADGANVCLQIEDNGTGFDLSSTGAHAGIGLASMQERAKRLGGRLEITSRPGKGTCLRLCLPCISHAGAQEEKASHPSNPQPLAGRNPAWTPTAGECAPL